MDLDDLFPSKPGDPLVELAKQDLDPMSIEELCDLTHMRLLLEEEALRKSIASGDDAWEAGVVAALHRLARLTERGAHLAEATLPEWEASHEDFHRAIIAAAGSRLLLRVRVERFYGMSR